VIPRCAFGARFPCGPCRKCQREADRLEAAFWRDVLFGRFDAEGYTLTDRAIQARRKAQPEAVQA
jgi:hypothetical protein